MKIFPDSCHFIAICGLFLCSPLALAGGPPEIAKFSDKPACLQPCSKPCCTGSSGVPLNEFSAKSSYTFASDFIAEDRVFGDVDTWKSSLFFFHRFPIGSNGLYFGTGAEYHSSVFDDSTAPIPDLLQSIAGRLSLEWITKPGAKFALITTPGVYFSEKIDSDDFDIPTTLFYAFDLTQRLRLYLGLRASLMDEFPVLPGGGLSWQINDTFRLDLTAPKGGVTISPLNGNISFWAGGELVNSSHRTDSAEKLPAELRNALISYSELRVGGGVNMKLSRHLGLGIEGGYLLDRAFDYHRADRSLELENAPYVQASISLSF